MTDYLKHFTNSLKKHKVIAVLVIAVIVVISLAQFLGAIATIWNFVFPSPKFKLTNAQLREQAMQLSNDINFFVQDRMENEPQIDYNNWQDSVNKLTQYSQASVTLYFVKYNQRLADVRQEFILRKITDTDFEQFYNLPTNYIGMQIVSQRLSIMIAQLPQ
jgi:hypothetical protein